MLRVLLHTALLGLALAPLVGCKPRGNEAAHLQGTAVELGDGREAVDLEGYVATAADHAAFRAELPEIGREMQFNPPRYESLQQAIEGLDAYRAPTSPWRAVPMEELAALRVYTGGAYRVINKALRGGPEARKKYAGTVRTMASGLAKMQVFAGTVTRGVTLEAAHLAPYEVGKRVVEAAFTSTTMADSDVTAFAGNVKFVIESKKGRRVDWLSESPEEEEVLFSPGATFDVLSRETKMIYSRRERKEVPVIVIGLREAA